MNDSNLKPYKPGEQRAKENGKKGGLKKAENLREQKKTREIIKELLAEQPNEEEVADFIKRYNSFNAEEITKKTLLLDKQIQKALDGDIKATKFIIELIGEYETKEPGLFDTFDLNIF